MQIALRSLGWLGSDHPLLEYYKFLGEQAHRPHKSSCKKYTKNVGFMDT